VTGDFVFDEFGWPVGGFVTKAGSSEIINGRKARTDAEMHTLRLSLSYRF